MKHVRILRTQLADVPINTVGRVDGYCVTFTAPWRDGAGKARTDERTMYFRTDEVEELSTESPEPNQVGGS